MSKYRKALPQLEGGIYLTDAGLETDLIFNHGIEIREFAAHTLLESPAGRKAMAGYFRPFLALAKELGTGFILDTQTWKAHSHWAEDLGATEEDLIRANRDSVAFVSELRQEFVSNAEPILISGIIGPQGDGYSPNASVAAAEAEEYHSRQIGWLAQTEVDLVTAVTFNQSAEAIGFVRAARKAGLPVVVSFTVETDGRLPSGQPLGEAVCAVDEATDGESAYFMVNCAHPEHFFHVFDESPWTRRIRGLRCNASRLSHAELDACESLDDGDPEELGNQYLNIYRRMPWLNVFGSCCGSDFRHVAEVARAVLGA